MADWSPQQRTALKRIEEWFRTPGSPQVFRLFGYAGTGKTTLALKAAQIVRDIVGEETGSADGAVLFAAFTGKASQVMRSKGCDGASTLHSLIYNYDEERQSYGINPGSKLWDAKLLIVDECSMVGAELGADVLSFDNAKVLVLGDPAQLPPVGDAGYFTNAEPDAMLTEVHRQAEGNPIIRLSMEIRAGAALSIGDYGACRVVPWRREALSTADILYADQVLCGKNDTRAGLNKRIRELKKLSDNGPFVGEKLVCLRNDRTKSIFNGGIYTVAKRGKFNPEAKHLDVLPEDAATGRPPIKVKVHPFCFEGRERELTREQQKHTQQFTYGYALTVHKSQGSQWNNVVLFDESHVFRDDAQRWLYTGVTRAAEKLMVVMA